MQYFVDLIAYILKKGAVDDAFMGILETNQMSSTEVAEAVAKRSHKSQLNNVLSFCDERSVKYQEGMLLHAEKMDLYYVGRPDSMYGFRIKKMHRLDEGSRKGHAFFFAESISGNQIGRSDNNGS